MNKILFVFILMFVSVPWATELRQFGENTKSTGMGGVRVPQPNRAFTFLTNPAYLSQVKGINWDLFQLGLSTNGYSKAQELSSFQYTGIESISDYYGTYLNLNYQGYSALATPNFGIAVYDQGYFDMIPHNPAFPVLDMTFMNDYAFAMGGSFPVGPMTSFGITGKRITRRGSELQLGASLLNDLSDAASLVDQFEDEGVGYGFDLGILHSLPGPMNPAISIAWKDVGSTAFTKTNGSSAPERIKDDLSASMTFHGDTAIIGLSGGLEYRHITDANEPLGKKIHAGLELNLPMLDLRAGLYQGYVTYGVGIDLLLVQFDASLYSVERGAYPGQTPDQRIQVGIGMNFGFDPDFNLVDASGKRRKLKQRR